MSIRRYDNAWIGSPPMLLSKICHSKGNLIQKFETSYTVMTNRSFYEYVLIKISDDWQILCKLIPQLFVPSTFGCCDVSVLIRTSGKLIHPLTMKLDKKISKDDIKPIRVINTKNISISVVFKEVEHQNVWSNNQYQNQNILTDAIRNMLQLFVVHNNCIVSLERFGSSNQFNIDLILVHKAAYLYNSKNYAAQISSETTITIFEMLSTIEYNQVKIGLEVKPLFGMEPQVSLLKAIIKAARNGCSPLCNMVGILLFNKA